MCAPCSAWPQAPQTLVGPRCQQGPGFRGVPAALAAQPHCQLAASFVLTGSCCAYCWGDNLFSDFSSFVCRTSVRRIFVPKIPYWDFYEKFGEFGFLSYDKASQRRGKVSCARSQPPRFIAISHTDHIILSCPLNKRNVNNQRACNQTAAGSDGYPQEKSDFSRTRRAQSLPMQSTLGTETQPLLDSGPMTASPCGSPSAVSTQPCRMARHPLLLFCCGWQPARGSALTPYLPPNTSLLVPAGSRVPCPQAQHRSPFPAAHFGATLKAACGSLSAAPTPTAHGPGGPHQPGHGTDP